MSTHSVSQDTVDRNIFADTEALTRKLRLIHAALTGLTVLHGGTDLQADLLPIQLATHEVLTIAEAIEEAGIHPPAAPDTAPAA